MGALHRLYWLTAELTRGHAAVLVANDVQVG